MLTLLAKFLILSFQTTTCLCWNAHFSYQITCSFIVCCSPDYSPLVFQQSFPSCVRDQSHTDCHNIHLPLSLIAYSSSTVRSEPSSNPLLQSPSQPSILRTWARSLPREPLARLLLRLSESRRAKHRTPLQHLPVAVAPLLPVRHGYAA